MTCIAGYRENKKIWIGADSLGAGGSSCVVRKDEKVFQNGEMLFGYTSSFRMGQLLRFAFKPPEQSKHKGDYEYLCTDFIDAVAKLLKDKQYASEKSNVLRIGNFLLGYKGELYEIEGDLQVAMQVKPYMACGCGFELALGAMHALERVDVSPQVKITRALEAAEEFSSYVRSPFIIKSI